MHQVLILSGKGGAGKTSLAASFATLAGPCVVADADVDAADLHLLLAPRGGEEEEEFWSGLIATVDPERCTRCGRCPSLCRFDALTMEGAGGAARVDPIACEGCGVCQDVCVDGAVTLEPRLSGRLRTGRAATGPLVHARLKPGAGNSGKLVTEVRSRALALAEAEGLDLVLVDGPPGLGCPVIACLSGVSLVVLVVEPSVSGIHDLLRVLGLVRHFNKRACVVINKADLEPGGTAQVESICASQEVDVLARIPYHPEVTAAMVAGRPVVTFNPDGPPARAMARAWEGVTERLAPVSGS